MRGRWKEDGGSLLSPPQEWGQPVVEMTVLYWRAMRRDCTCYRIALCRLCHDKADKAELVFVVLELQGSRVPILAQWTQ